MKIFSFLLLLTAAVSMAGAAEFAKALNYRIVIPDKASAIEKAAAAELKLHLSKSAFAADTFADPLVNVLLNAGVPISAGILNTICVILITLTLAFINIVFGELVPKRLAMKNPEKKALGISGFLVFISKLFAPIVFVLSKSTNGLLKLLGVSPEQEEEQVTEEEIILMAETGSEQGLIESEENEYIKNIFDFKDQTVIEACTHRKDTILLFLNESDDEWIEKIKNSKHTYFPICGNTIDDVVGVLNTKKYFRLDNTERQNVLKNAVETPMFVNENIPCNEVLLKMKTKREYFAIVVDEYGGMCGIITLQDLIKLIVGDFIEKDETADYEIIKINDTTWEIQGIAPFDEVIKRLELNISLEETDDFETFGGYVIYLKGDIPLDNETFEVTTENFNAKILKVEKKCITKMIVEVIKKEIEEE